MNTHRRLTDLQIRRSTGPAMLSDGGGLYLRIRSTKAWVFLYSADGKRTEMSLGRYPTVSLTRARELAHEARRLRFEGIDPLSARRAGRASTATFGMVADEVIEKRCQGFRNAKHRQQWRNSLETYCESIWELPVAKVDTKALVQVLEPIWLLKPETAQRLRGRIEKVIDAATVQGARQGPNPALWKGSLESLLSHQPKLVRGHHKALPWEDLPAFVKRLVCIDAVSAKALEFLILTAARSGECLGARWEEIDLEAGLWKIPPSRMKANREHRVPLSERAVRCIAPLHVLKGDYVFQGAKAGRPLSGMALAKLVQRMGAEVTVHGFRSTFRDWVSDQTDFPWEVGEAALAHNVGGKVERAYRRGDALEKRRRLMEAWASYAGSKVR